MDLAANFLVNGEAAVWLGTGSSSALERLGISVDGVTWEPENPNDPVYIDTYFKTPCDYQYSPTMATVSMDLVYFDPAVLAKVNSGFLGTADGTLAAAGGLMLAGSGAYRLLIKSTPSGTGLTGNADCHNFLNAFLMDKRTVKMGTERSTWKLTFKCLAAFQTSSTVGAVLYNTTCT